MNDPNVFLTRPGRTQKVAAAAASAASTNAFAAQIVFVYVVSDQPAFIQFAATPVAVTDADLYLPANSPRIFKVSTGEKMAAIKAGATDGSVWVSELTR